MFSHSYIKTLFFSLFALYSDDGEETIQTYTFDFFNYAGIHRPVHLYTTPNVGIDDIHIETNVQKTMNGDKGIFIFNQPQPNFQKLSLLV